MATDVGSQTVSILYHSSAASSVVNKRHLDIRQVGIYQGGYLTKVDNTHAQLSSLVCEITDGTHQVRIETASSVNIAVAVAIPYIVLRWTYTGSATADYMEVLAVATPATNDVVVGLCTFTGGGGLNSFDYGDNDYPRTTPDVQSLFLKVEPTEGTELKVRIRAGRVHSNSQVHDIPDQKSTLFTAPSANSKVYLVYINTTTGAIAIDTSGTEAASPVAPGYDGRLILAEVTLASTDTNITVDKIKNVRNFITAPAIPDDSTIELDGNGKFSVKNPAVDKYLVVLHDGDQCSSQSSWTKLQLITTVKRSGIDAIVSSQVTLAADTAYVISYQVEYHQLNDTPIVQARVAVVSGDSTWNLETVTHQTMEMGSGPDVEDAVLSGTYIFKPSSETVIRLEAITKNVVQTAKVTKATLSIWNR